MVRFFRCDVCGKVVAVVNDTAPKMTCCNQLMTELVPGTTDGAMEKHVPVFERNDDVICIKVGSVEHPMMEKHFINFIVLETDKGFQIRKLTYNDKPEAEFKISEGEKPVAVYEYCNLHGLWKTDC